VRTMTGTGRIWLHARVGALIFWAAYLVGRYCAPKTVVGSSWLAFSQPLASSLQPLASSSGQSHRLSALGRPQVARGGRKCKRGKAEQRPFSLIAQLGTRARRAKLDRFGAPLESSIKSRWLLAVLNGAPRCFPFGPEQSQPAQNRGQLFAPRP